MATRIPDGDPIPMSEFTLGPRYLSEDMYLDFPDLKTGDRIAVEIGGVVYTDTIQGHTATSATPAAYPRQSWWQRMVRRLTPKRFRKPIQPVRAARPAEVSIQIGEDPIARHHRRLKEVEQAIGSGLF